MRPCDCKSQEEAKRYLNEQGLVINNDSICVQPNYVLLILGHTQVKISMRTFKLFSEWYLTYQDKKAEGTNQHRENKITR